MHKKVRNLGEKLLARFPTATHGYSMVRISFVNGSFLGILELEVSPVEGLSL